MEVFREHEALLKRVKARAFLALGSRIPGQTRQVDKSISNLASVRLPA